MKSPFAWLLLGIMNFYRRYLSPLSQPRCKFYPTCSTYGIEAVSTHGALKGFLLLSYRLLRCHPWSLGGVDYVPLKGTWHSAPYYSMSDDELHQYWKDLDNSNNNSELIQQRLSLNTTLATQRLMEGQS